MRASACETVAPSTTSRIFCSSWTARRATSVRARAIERAGAPPEVDRERAIATSCVVNAFVDATPISGPACV
jgi:hypothetical protein